LGTAPREGGIIVVSVS